MDAMMAENDLQALESCLRRIDESAGDALATLEGHMQFTVGKEEGKVVALGDNGVVELIISIQNEVTLALRKARRNLYGKKDV